MLDTLLAAAQAPHTPWIVLGLAGLAVAVEAFRVSPRALWADIFTEEMDEVC